MSPDDLVARLDQRFKLLTRGSRAALERHQTLRNTIAWSYELLDTTERRTLNRLSVFAGGWDLRAAEGIVADDDGEALDVDDWLSQLVDKSLVVVEGDPRTGVVRYRLHESIRQYAQEQLEADGETAALRRRHAEYYVEWAEWAQPHFRGREYGDWTDAAMREVDNFRAALDWAVDMSSADHALRLVAPMTLQGVVGEPALDWSVTACGIPGASDHELFPDVAGWASWRETRALNFVQAEAFALAAREAEEALRMRRPNVSRAFGTLELYRGNLEQARDYAREWVEVARQVGDAHELAHALNLLGGVLQGLGDDSDVETLEEAVRVAREGGVDSATVFALPFLAGALPLEESDRAYALLEEAIGIATRDGDPMALAATTWALGSYAAQLGQWNLALSASVRALDMHRRIGDYATGRGSLAVTAVALYWLGSLEPAALLLAKARAMQSSFVGSGRELVDQAEANLLERLGGPRVAELGARGVALSFSEAVEYAQSEAEKVLAATSAPAS
jgi:tetratricopeptide (TPR) repeat protein